MAIGSPLSPVLADFDGFHESTLFDNTTKPGVYFQYVDDSFVIVGSELDCDHFREKLNLLHPALYMHNREGAKQLLDFSRCFGRERGHWISYL